MEVAFGFDPDASDDKPFLKNEVSEQLQHQLQRIKEETTARMTNSSNGDNQQQSGISSAGLIDTAHKIRAEKDAMYERVAALAIAEQQSHHEAAQKLEALQAASMQAHREKAKNNGSKTKAFRSGHSDGPQLTVRSVELV